MATFETVPAAEIARDFCVVGVGASAGGLEALRAFFSRMPAQPGFACVVVVHLSPEHESHLVQMLQPLTQMTVCQVVKTTALEPNHVYVIPPNANLNSIDTHLRLTQPEGRSIERATIDHFLRTLAETHCGQAIGVILSGAGSDGALGIREIKEHGGLTLAQDPGEADYGSMPRSAIATGTVDIVLPAREMAEEIAGYCATQPWTASRGKNDELAEHEASVLARILGAVRLCTGQEFAMLRPELVVQRVRRRMRLWHVGSLEAYFEVLNSHAEEPRALYEELISVNHESRYRSDTLAELSNDLQHLLESTGFAMVLLDRQLRVVRFTPRAATILRLQQKDVGRPLADFKSHLQYQELIADLSKVAAELTDLEAEAGSDDGRWYLVHAQPYRTARRVLEGISLLFVDITDRKRAELALQESDRRKEEFLAVLAHELRNPLAPIVSGLEVLRRTPQDRALVERITATMARQTKQLVMLVDDLLEVVRINEDKLTLRLQAVSIAEVVRDAVSATRPLMAGLEHRLSIEVPTERLTVRGDAARLTQVIGNLLNNAARYTPSGGQITLRVGRDGEHVLISVADNGRGLPPQSLRKVFEMFYQAGESGDSSTGLGIGLTLAKKLVEMHGGIISAESGGAGMGSTFTVRLPLAQGEDPVSAPEPPDEAGESAPPHRVLIVDDNTDAAETLRLLMKSLGGGEVRTASNGVDALEAAATLQPDVVLLDLSMPGMDGYELARRIRAESWGKRVLLVALTGWGQDQHRRRSHEAGFDCHMIKPANAEALRAVLKSTGTQRALLPT